MQISMERGCATTLGTRDSADVEKIHKLATSGGMMSVRKRLGDITNLNPNERVFKVMADTGKPNPNAISSSAAKDYNQLLKENSALAKMLAEKTQIIEYNNLELQKVRLAIQKFQQQNWQLAQAHSQILAELNLGKNRLKLLQHELSCTVATLKANDLKLEEKEKASKLVYGSITNEEEKPTRYGEAIGDGSRLVVNKKTFVPDRNQSPENISAAAAKTTIKKDVNKRRSMRNQSGCLKPHACEVESLVSLNEATAGEPIVGDKRKSTKRQSRNFNAQSCEPGISTCTDESENDDQKDGNKRRSMRNQSGYLKPHACEVESVVSLNEAATGEPKVGDKRKSIKRQSRNFKPESCEPDIPTSSDDPENDDKKDGNRRGRTKRRTTGNFKTQAHEPKSPISKNEPMKDCCIPKETDRQHQDQKTGCSENNTEARELPDYQNDSAQNARRSSITRPSRRATIGVSYKERPINVKMRRSSRV